MRLANIDDIGMKSFISAQKNTKKALGDMNFIKSFLRIAFLSKSHTTYWLILFYLYGRKMTPSSSPKL